ncbi:MAG: 30S ribosomal protein S6 [Bdellovibrionales bacterium]
MEFSIEKPLRKYEAVIILNPDVTEAEQKNFFKRNQDTIQQHEGRVNHIDTWGKRRLANPIDKMKLGTYFHTTFEAKGNCVAELERLMKIDERVLRFLHLKLDDRISLTTHVDGFHSALAESLKREQEKEAKFQARRTAGGGGGGFGSRGPRESNYGSKRHGGTDSDDDQSGEEI